MAALFLLCFYDEILLIKPAYWSFSGQFGRLSGPSGHQPLHAGDVVRRCRKAEDPGHFVPPTVAKLSHQSNVLHPSKTFFNLFSFYLTDLITHCTGRAFIHLTAAGLGSHMGSNFQCPTALHKFARIITLIRTNSHAGTRAKLGQNSHAGIPLLTGSRFAHFSANNQTVTILSHNVSHVTKPALFAFGLAKQPGIRVGLRLMRFVATLLAMEIIARAIIVSVVFVAKRFHRDRKSTR